MKGGCEGGLEGGVAKGGGMHETVLVLQIFSKSRSFVVKNHVFVYAKCGEMYGKLMVSQVSRKSRSIFVKNHLFFCEIVTSRFGRGRELRKRQMH